MATDIGLDTDDVIELLNTYKVQYFSYARLSSDYERSVSGPDQRYDILRKYRTYMYI